jgi:hypothetical protein
MSQLAHVTEQHLSQQSSRNSILVYVTEQCLLAYHEPVSRSTRHGTVSQHMSRYNTSITTYHKTVVSICHGTIPVSISRNSIKSEHVTEQYINQHVTEQYQQS